MRVGWTNWKDMWRAMAGKTALIVDDDEAVRLFVSAILEGEGWRCLEAVNGEEAVDVAESEQPDLVVLDINMPVMDGFEAFRRLRSSPFTEQIPVIMLTGVNADEGTSHDAGSVERDLGLPGPEGFVDKPVDAVFLLNCIMGVMG